jgi:hypothetical protein
MKVSNLIKQLKDMPQDMDVIMPINPEGDGWNNIDTVGTAEACEDGYVYCDGEPTDDMPTLEVVALWP